MKGLMGHIGLFVKGLFIGVGGVAPGLSGSVIMISLGLYSRTIDALATITTDFKKKIVFIGPIVSGMLVSTVVFSRVIGSLLENFEIQTRLAFFGMLIGTIPLFFREVRRKERLSAKHYIIMLPAFLLGLGLLLLGNRAAFAEAITMPIAFILGFLGIVLTIIPGFNWATFFSAIGLYEHWLTLMSFRPEDFSAAVYITALAGAVIGLATVTKLVSYLLNKAYTITLSALFGFFIAVIPSIIIDSGVYMEDISLGAPVFVGAALFFAGIFIALVFGRLSKSNTK